MTKSELRVLENKIKNIVMKSDRVGSKGNPLHWKMRYVEDAVEDVPVYGLLFQFDFPYKPGYSFQITKEKESGACVFTLLTPEKTYTVRDDKEGYKQTSYEMEQVMIKNGLAFAPPFDQEFLHALEALYPGTRISLNTGMELACIKKDEKGVLLKSTYTGDIFSVSIDNFKNSKEYLVNCNRPETVQELYGASYDSRIQTSNMRVRFGTEDGYTVVKKAEDAIKVGAVRSFHIGQMVLRASKSEHGKTYWYDSDGSLIDRSLVASIFGWAKNAMAYVSNVDQEYWFAEVPEDKTAIFKKLNKAAFAQDGQMFMRIAFDYAKETNRTLFASMSGLEEQKNGDYDFITYAFHVDADGKETIIKLHYDQNEKVHDMPCRIEESSQAEFLAFYKAKYDLYCQHIEAIHAPMIKQALEEAGKDTSTVQELSEKVVEESLKKLESAGTGNLLKITEDDLQNVNSSVRALVDDFVENGFQEDTLTEYFTEKE